MTGEEFDGRLAGKEAPVVPVSRKLPPEPIGVGLVAGRPLEIPGIVFRGDEAGHEDLSRVRDEDYLLSGRIVGRDPPSVIWFDGDVADGEAEGRDVLEVHVEEGDSCFDVLRSAGASVSLERVLAKALVLCEWGSHLEKVMFAAYLDFWMFTAEKRTVMVMVERGESRFWRLGIPVVCVDRPKMPLIFVLDIPNTPLTLC